MSPVVRELYARARRASIERWVGSLHAGALVKGLYVQWTLGPLLRQATGIVLDAGCGELAQFTRLLARRLPALRFLGLDLKLAPHERLPANVWLCMGDLRALPLRGPLRAIVCVDVLEHVEDARALLFDFARCLPGRGMLFLHVPSRDERTFLPGVDREYSWLGPPRPGDRHFWSGFDLEELRRWLDEAGFDVVSSRCTFGRAVETLKELFMLGEARRVPGVGLGLLPFVTLAAWAEWRWGCRRGNGLVVLAVRR